MDLKLKRDSYEHCARVFSKSMGRELDEETVVPDALPDVGTVIDAQGFLYVRSKEAGEGFAVISAAVSASVLYAPAEGGAVRCVEAELPCELRFEGSDISDECRVVSDVRLLSLDARAINSRKRAEVGANISCYCREGMSVASGIEGEGAHALIEEAAVMLVSDVREKTFVVTDEYAVPAGLDGGVKVIGRRVSASAEDVKYVSGKVIVRGRTTSELTFSDEEGNIRACRQQTEFSQIMEVDASAEDVMAQAGLMLTGAYFDLPEYGEGAERVQAELHFAMQCVCRVRKKLPYLADVYANRTCLMPAFEETAALMEARPVSMRQTVAGRAEPESEGQIVIINAAVGAISVERGTVKTSILIRTASLSPDGTWTPAKCRLSAEFTLPEAESDMSLADVTVAVTDVYGAGSDVRAVLQMDAVLTREGAVRSVSGVTEDAEAFSPCAQTPSVTLVRAAPGASLWELAKSCGSSVEAIEQANADRREGFLLVPKAK